jgi:multiple sugar transport system permease protein
VLRRSRELAKVNSARHEGVTNVSTISGTAEQAQATAPLVGRPDVNRRRMARLGWAFSAPALIVVAAVTIFPIVYSVIMSLSHVTVTGSGINLNGFTWSNYSIVFQNSTWHYALVFTIVYTFITVLVELIIGTMIALVLERLTAGRGWMMALLLLPWSMITVINAELWAYIFNGVYGVADAILNAVGLGHPNILGTNTPAIIALMIADIWKTTPFVAIIVLAGLVMIPGDLYEAAEVDGSSGWSTFWRITLPLLRNTLALAVLFRVLQAFGLFDLPYVMTLGGPGTATTSLAILGYKALFQNLDFGTGSAVATTTAALVLIGCLVSLKAFKVQVGKEES